MNDDLHDDLEKMRDLRAEVILHATRRDDAQQRLSEHCAKMKASYVFPKGGILHAGRYWMIRNRGLTFFPVDSDRPFGARRGWT